MKPEAERFVATLLVVLFCIGSYILKVRVNETSMQFDPKDPTCFYWTESAIQYHYAELVANGNKIPDFDPMFQAPEGTYIKRNLTTLMENLAGRSYRLLGLHKKSYPFHRFTIRFIAAFSIVMVVSVFLLVRQLGVSEISSALASGLWGFALASVSRSVGGFLHEDIALPFFTMALALFFMGLKSKRAFVLGILSGVFFALSLASWHFSRFLFLTFAVGAAFGFVAFTQSIEERKFFVRTLEGLFIPVLISAFLVPVLFEKRFFISSSLFLILGTIIGFEFLFKKDSIKSIALTVLFFWILGFIVERTFGDTEGYKHVWSLFLAKLMYLNIKPDEPSMLPYYARSLWIEEFNIPSLSGALFHLFPLGILSIWGFSFWIKRKDLKSRLITFWGLMYGALFLIVQRLRVVFLPIWIIWACGIEFFPRLKRYGAWILLAIFVIFHANESFSIHHPTLYRKMVRSIFGPEDAPQIYNWQMNDIQLARWIRLNTKPNEIFLSRFAVGGLILAYGNRPVALQPKFEVANIKTKVRDFENALYSDEEAFYKLCQRWKISYFVYDIKLGLDSSQDSTRWVSGNLWLSKNSAAFMFQFNIERLKHFELVYQNSFYRVFRVLKQGELAFHKDFGPQPIFDIRFFNNQKTTGEIFNDAFTLEAFKRMDTAIRMASAAQSLLITDPRRALEISAEAFKIYPGTPGVLTILGSAHALTGNLQKALEICELAVKADPYLPLAHYNLGFVLARLGRFDEARLAAEKALKLQPDLKPAKILLKQIEQAENK